MHVLFFRPINMMDDLQFPGISTVCHSDAIFRHEWPQQAAAAGRQVDPHPTQRPTAYRTLLHCFACAAQATRAFCGLCQGIKNSKEQQQQFKDSSAHNFLRFKRSFFLRRLRSYFFKNCCGQVVRQFVRKERKASRSFLRKAENC